MIFKNQSILFLTHDLRINQTSTNRYTSFIKALCNTNFSVIGLKYPFKPHPLFISKPQYFSSQEDCYEIIEIKILNVIQKLILFCDENNRFFFLKKYLLALHILFYKADQWLVDPQNFKFLNFKPTVIISGGTSGIFQSSAFLANKYKAKLILDYRDPWNFGYHLLETNGFIYRFKRLFTLRQEIKLLKRADHIITVSEFLKSFFPAKFQQKITIIENGSNYEQEDTLHQIVSAPPIFNIIYLGTIYNEQLKSELFFESLSNLIKNNSISPAQLKLYFLGSSLNRNLPKIIHKYELGLFTEITPRLSQKEILPYLLNASMFLDLKYDHRTQIITSKNADYLIFKKPILLPVSDHDDLAESIQKYKAGSVCNSVDKTIAVLQKEYQKFLNKESIMIHQKDLSHLSRTEISKKLVKVIEDLQAKYYPTIPLVVLATANFLTSLIIDSLS